jgi:hypothetical protein
MLFVIFLYIFATFGYLFFEKDFQGVNGKPENGVCDDILSCFYTILDKCFKFDGAIGSYLALKNEQDESNLGDYLPINF